MKIIHVNTFDIDGGAARSAYRLHQGLVKIGEDSRMLSRYKKSNDDTVFSVYAEQNHNSENLTNFELIEANYLYHNRTDITNTLFSLSYPGFDIAKLPIIQNADVINLHWIASQYQSPTTIKNLLALGKPVVWTLHDMFAFTGGCHYSAGCENYQTDCLNCPQLQDDQYNLPHAILQDKLEIFNHPNLAIITPSQWLANCAKKSKIFCHNRVEVIPYSLDTNIFTPINKSLAKKSLDFAPDEIVLLAGASTGKEKRKGFDELMKVLKICQQNEQFSDLINNNKIRLCCFGESIDSFSDLDFKITALGMVDSDEKLSQIYSSADMFILPSLEDNLPNTMLESMSCGTPVIAFNIGGIPDLVENEINGFLASEKDLQDMANKIIELIFNVPLREKMSNNCRQLMANNYSLEIQAQNYLKLYRQLININNLHSLNENLQEDLNKKEKNQLLVNINFDIEENFAKIKDKVFLYSLNQELKNLEKVIKDQQKDIEELYKIINNKDIHIEKTEQLIQKMDQDLISTHEQLVKTYGQLNESHYQLTIAKQQFNQTQQQLNQTQQQLNQTQQQLNQTQQQLNQTQQQLNQTQQQLNQTQERLNESNAIIQGMESSKFWQLRNKWFEIREKFAIKMEK